MSISFKITCTMHPTMKLFTGSFKVPTKTEIKEIRARLSMTQLEFADLFFASVDTVKGWETGRRVPSCSSIRLLQIVDTVAQEKHVNVNSRIRRAYK